ncbi:hypothetical protein BBP40_004449 [Aspergillus hancockii]|nr:hypothetical protein BBP40_004449 [Aspergillus hancockii]
MPQPFTFEGTSPQASPSPASTPGFNFRAVLPSIESPDDDPAPLIGGVSEPLRLLNFAETPPSSSHLALWRRDDRAESTGLSPGRSTSTYADLFNATPEPPLQDSRDRFTSDRGATVDGLANDLENSHLQDGEPPSDDSDQLSDGDNANSDSDDSTLYNVRHEQLPHARIYNTRLQEMLRDVKSQLSALHRDMDRCPLSRDHGSDLFHLSEKVRTLNELESPETRTVGFIGNSGVGKSRLINSLLDQEGLARSSGDGAACTSVVTEFRHTDARHPNRFTIEINYMDTKEVKELLEELVQSFRMYYTNLYREVDNIEEQERIRDRSTRAWSTLNSLFRDQPDLTHEFLSEETEGALHKILNRLEEWAARSCMRRPGGSALQHTINPGNVQECRSQLDMLTMDPHDEREIAIWPFIKLIRVYLRSPVLRTGLILADLPGFRDLNFARIRATERYLRHSCNEVFVVTTISRCISDQSIKEIKDRCVEGQPLRIVCTRSEEVNASETARDCRDLAVQIGQLEARLRQVNKRLARLRDSRRGSSIPSNDRTVNLLQLMQNKEDAELELDRFLIESRNRRVTRQLLLIHGAEVRIFCISNELYSKHRQSGMRHADTYVGLSGIRELRRYCQLVPAEAQFRFTAAFLENRVPAIVRSVKQWALAGSDNVTVERAETLRQVLLDVERVFRERLILPNSEVRTFPRRLEDRFHDDVLSVTNEGCSRWKAGALQTSMAWECWHHSTYAAFCRKYGTHSTKGAGYHCWNDELLEDMKTDLEERWASIEGWVSMQKASLEGNVKSIFQETLTQLENIMPLAPMALGNIADNMNDWEYCMIAAISQPLDKLIESFGRVATDTLNGHDSSYMAGLMRPAYNQCNSESGMERSVRFGQFGTGSHSRRKILMRNHIENSRIFPKLINVSETNRRAFARECYSDLQRMVNEEVGNIFNDLHTVVTEEGEVAEARRFPEIAGMLQRKVEAAQATLELAQRIVTELRNTPE